VTGTQPDLFATYHGPLLYKGDRPINQVSPPRETRDDREHPNGPWAMWHGSRRAPVLEQAERPWRQPAHAGDRPMERGDSSTILTLRPDLRYESKLATPSVAHPNVAGRGLRQRSATQAPVCAPNAGTAALICAGTSARSSSASRQFRRGHHEVVRELAAFEDAPERQFGALTQQARQTAGAAPAV
jgi:hypothetical protein